MMPRGKRDNGICAPMCSTLATADKCGLAGKVVNPMRWSSLCALAEDCTDPLEWCCMEEKKSRTCLGKGGILAQTPERYDECRMKMKQAYGRGHLTKECPPGEQDCERICCPE